MRIFKKKENAKGNTFREPEKASRKRAHSQNPRGNKSKNRETKGISIGSGIKQVLDGSLFANEKVIKNIPFILFISFLAILYIANSSVAEKNRRRLIAVTEELKELRYKYISTKSGVMYQSNPTQISSKLKETGIKESTTPPIKIFIPKEDLKR